MENITRTFLGTALQVASYRKLDHVILDNTTLNQKYEILKDTVPASGNNPSIGYFAIGKGGHVGSATTDGTAMNKNLTHRYSDASLYEQIPFVIRDLDNDLTVSQRANYGLRQKKNISGVDYWVYWIKRVTAGTETITLKKTTTTDGNSTTVEFVPTSDNLNPTKPTLSNTNSTTTSGITVTVENVISLDITEFDVAEIRNACAIMFGDADAAFISEIAVCSGQDKLSEIPLNDGTTTQMNEVIAVQCAHFIKSLKQLTSSDTGFSYAFNIGATEPILDAV